MNHTFVVNVRLSEREWKRADAIAALKPGQSVTSVVQQLITESLKTTDAYAKPEILHGAAQFEDVAANVGGAK